ncbi:MAG: ABC transporter, partial [Calditrichaeota bacterium]|nr:ABC transporter [Calditrichota bacterium]
MRNIWAIFKRELRAYFDSPTAYVVIIVFLLITGWFFTTNFFLVAQADMRVAFGIIPFVFIFITPAITMRLISEERKAGTIER